MSRAVHLVAVSACTPVGLSAETTAAAMRAGTTRLALQPQLRDLQGEPIWAARSSRLSTSMPLPKRIAVLATTALAELLDKLSVESPLPDGCVVQLALAEPRPGLELAQQTTLLGEIAKYGSARASALQVVAASAPATGHAGALAAMAQGADRIRKGEAELCIVGGADSYLERPSIDWLEAEQHLSRPGRQGGMMPGEAASFVALASEPMRRALQLPALAQVRGVATTHESRSWSSAEGLLGESLSEAIHSATADLHWPEDAIHATYGDLNGEQLRRDDWVFASLRTAPLFAHAGDLISPSPFCGDSGAASGALACTMAVASFRRRYALGPRALLLGASWTGLRVACVLEDSGGGCHG